MRVSDLEVGRAYRRLLAFPYQAGSFSRSPSVSFLLKLPSIFLFSSSFSLSFKLHLPFGTLIPYAACHHVCLRPLRPSLCFSRAFAEAHYPGVARYEFPAGKHPELLTQRFLYDFAQFALQRAMFGGEYNAN